MDTVILAARVVVSLVAVFGLMWLVQRKLRTGGAATRAKALSVVARQSVGQKASVVLVDTGGQRLLLGVTEHGIAVLHTGEAPEPEPVDAGAPTAQMFAASTDLIPVVDPTADRLVRDEDGSRATPMAAVSAPAPAPALPTRREVRQATFEEALTRQRAGLGTAAAADAPRGAGSILEAATWRLAADAIRSSRRS